MKRKLAKTEKAWAIVLMPENVLCATFAFTKREAMRIKPNGGCYRLAKVIIKEIK